MRHLPAALALVALACPTLAGLTLAGLTLAGPAQADPVLNGLPALSEVAPDAVQVSPHMPHMGAHWAEPAHLPDGPIYCVIEGRIVCVEYMFEAGDLQSGRDWTVLKPGIRTPPISHIDVEFKPEGIEPHPVPLYQLHIYFADPEFLARH